MRLSIRMLVSFVTTLILGTSTLGAQTMTTGVLVGTVMDEQGAVLPGADVVAVHEPTGTRYETVTAGDGRYQLLNVRVGGPYNITASLAGFREKTLVVASVALGEAATTDFKLRLENVQETVTVTAETPLIDSTRAGTAANISKDTIENLPTISRSISDFARTSPFVNLNPASANSDSGHQRGRAQHSLQQHADRWGREQRRVRHPRLRRARRTNGEPADQPRCDSGNPGSRLTVRRAAGGFSGGGINAITRSGANSFSGTAYWFQRSEALVGQIPAIATAASPSPADTKVGVFSDKQNGFSVGGPIVKNKAFFFTNLDWARKHVPTGFSADGTGGQNWAGGAHLADIQQIAAIAKSKYGYDIGALGQLSPPLNSNKFFGRGDFNLSNSNRLAFRVNYIDGLKNLTSSGQPGTLNYAMPTAFYDSIETVTSPVGQLNSTFGSSGYNEFRVTYTRDRFHRALPTPNFPYVRIDFPDQLTLRFGSEQNSHANELDQDATEITDDVTLVHGTHSFTFGTHNEFFKFRNVFIANLYGAYEFTGVQSFCGRTRHWVQPDLLELVRSAAGGQVLSAAIWRIRRRPVAREVEPLPHLRHSHRQTELPGQAQCEPDCRRGLRLRHGRRSGAHHVVAACRVQLGCQRRERESCADSRRHWLLHGAHALRVAVKSIQQYRRRFHEPERDERPNESSGPVQPRSPESAQDDSRGANGASDTESYRSRLQVPGGRPRQPRVRPELGVLGPCGGGRVPLHGQCEGHQVREPESRADGGKRPDGRLVFQKKDNNLNEAIFLTNTGEGSSWSTSVKVERPFRNSWSASGSYLYNRATSITDGVSSVARSNYVNNPAGIDPNNPDNTRSVYSVGSRVNFTSSIRNPAWQGADQHGVVLLQRSAGPAIRHHVHQ